MRSFELLKPTEYDNNMSIYRYADGRLYYKYSTQDDSFSRKSEDELLNMLGGELLFVVNEYRNNILVRVISRTKEVTAIELTDYVFGSFGVFSGDAGFCRGKMSSNMLRACAINEDIPSVNDFFLNRIDSYFNEVDEIYCNTFAAENPAFVDKMKRYRKKPVSWAYVKSTDIAAAGEHLFIKTLENDAGVDVQIADDVYIMIGVHGEVYEIHRDKFEASYRASEEVLDIFDKYFDYIPAVTLKSDGREISIDEMAHLCYPAGNTIIRARMLENRTRVYRSEKKDYFTGRVGDYLAIREDDHKDIYVIRNEIFTNTYEECDEDKKDTY